MSMFSDADWEHLGCPGEMPPKEVAEKSQSAGDRPAIATVAPNPWLGDRFESAFAYTLRIHGGQVRKTTTVPYVSHLLGVAALVLDNGGTEDEAIGGLLHDAAEDQGGEERLADIRRRFNDRVGDIVAACSDSFGEPKPSWSCRKRRYLAHLGTISDQGILLVSCCDKLWNARAIIRDLLENNNLFDAFNMKEPERQVTYYELLGKVYSARMHGHRPLAKEFGRAVDEFAGLITGMRHHSRAPNQ